MPAVETLLLESIQPRKRRGGWHGGPTPMGAVRGVSAEEASWVPAPGRHSIWALTLHIAYWKYAVRRRLEGGEAPRFSRSPANWPDVPDGADEKRWRDDIALLAAEHDRLLDVVRSVPASQYSRATPKGKRWTKGELITGIAMHDAYHAGQIVMLKRLYSATR
jgi:hypothetical protein